MSSQHHDFLKSLDPRTRDLVVGILNETSISEKGREYHLKTVLSPEQYTSYLTQTRHEPAFLSLIEDGTTAELVRDVLKETWMEGKQRDALVEKLLGKGQIFREYLKQIGETDQVEKESFLKELEPVIRRMVDKMLDDHQIMKAELLLRSTASAPTLELFQKWKIAKRLEPRREQLGPTKSHPADRTEPEGRSARRQFILILGERQVDTLYVVSALVNYLENGQVPTGRKVRDIGDFCECDNWHHYVLECQVENETREIHLVPLYEHFLLTTNYRRISDYLQNKVFNCTVIASGMDLREIDIPQPPVISCFEQLFGRGSFKRDNCLFVFESSFVSEQAKTPRHFWLVTNGLTNCRALRICETPTRANKNYSFITKDWEKDVAEIKRMFKAMESLTPLQSNLTLQAGCSDSLSVDDPFPGEIRLKYPEPFTILE